MRASIGSNKIGLGILMRHIIVLRNGIIKENVQSTVDYLTSIQTPFTVKYFKRKSFYICFDDSRHNFIILY